MPLEMTPRFDLVVIGGGTAGLTATRLAARLGARVLLVERAQLGGSELHDGTLATKTLIASARLAHAMRNARDAGLIAGGVRVDARAVMARVRRVEETRATACSVSAVRAEGAEVLLGEARFVAPHAITVDGARIEGHRFLVATGASPVIPRVAGLEAAGFLDHRGVFRLETIPRRLAVIGGGRIGVELAQAFLRLGAEVTLLERGPRLVAREEPEIAHLLRQRLEAEGMSIRLEATPEAARRAGNDKILEYRQGDRLEVLTVDELVVAAGRAPTLAGLDLGAAGVEVTPRGIQVDDQLQTSRPHIFAAGDCTGGPKLAHLAEHEARVATRNALFFGSERRSLDHVPWVTFTDPEIARVGLTEAEARATYGSILVRRLAFEDLDRAVIDGDPFGFIQVVADAKERILGVHAIGHGVGELLAEWVVALTHPEIIRLSTIASLLHPTATWGRANQKVAERHFLEHNLPEWKIRLGARFRPRDLP